MHYSGQKELQIVATFRGFIWAALMRSLNTLYYHTQRPEITSRLPPRRSGTDLRPHMDMLAGDVLAIGMTTGQPVQSCTPTVSTAKQVEWTSLALWWTGNDWDCHQRSHALRTTPERSTGTSWPFGCEKISEAKLLPTAGSASGEGTISWYVCS